MEDATKIVSQSQARLNPSQVASACLVHIYPTGPDMGVRYSLETKPLVLGRDGDCTIRLSDESVSRHHAIVELFAGSHRVVDLKSTNGTFVNDQRIECQTLKDGDYLHIGNAIFRFLTGGNVEAQYHEEIYRLTIMDALTGVHNKRYLMELLAKEVSSSLRFRSPLSLILFDLDRFKSINDSLGHLAGDYTLRELASVVKGLVRKIDIIARFGGEEFALVVPDTDLEGARQIAERLRVLVQNHSFEYDGCTFPLTVSAGVAMMSGFEWETTSELIRRADEKLFEAKRGGRNCVAS